MNRTTIIVAVGLAFAVALPTAPAHAQNVRSYVASYGNNANYCSLGAPCRNLQTALAATVAGGEITILDAAGYNSYTTVTIDKAISIVNQGGFQAGIGVPSGGTGIVINAGPGDAVSLRGLTIEGAGVGGIGIQFNTGQSLTVENCVIRHLAGRSPAGTGIFFTPNATSNLSVSNTVVSDNGNMGIEVLPSGPGTVKAVFNRVEANNNQANGIFVYGSNYTGTIRATVYDSRATGNGGTGIMAAAFGAEPATLMVFHSVSANNTYGLVANGSGATLRVANSMVTGNTYGWVTNSGVLQSYGNNSIDGNTNYETAPPSIPLK